MRGIRLRIASLVIAVAFQGVAVAEALRIQECPHHDALPAPALDAHSAMADAAGDASHGAGPQDHGPTEEHDEHGACTCVSACEVGGGVGMLAVAAAADLSAEPVGPERDGPRDRGGELPGPPHFLLPYALGPPQAQLV
jgi:hypothetical protein